MKRMAQGWVVAVAAISACVLPAAADEPGAKTGGTSDYDAAFVSQAVPEEVAAHEVFSVKITLRNTGTQSWGSWPIRLRSVGPENNTRWGTSYILVRQGRRVESGQEYTFASRLRAPGEAGQAAFQWRMCKDGRTWFGETTPEKVIRVKPAPPPAATRPAATPRAADGKKVLGFDDFAYAGSFKLPRTVEKARGAFSATGIALRPTEDGPPRLLVNYTHPKRMLFEVEVPDPVKVADGGHGALATATVAKVWGGLGMPADGTRGIGPNGGFVWVPETRVLMWTWYHGYKTGAAPPVLGATKLGDDGKLTYYGPWRVKAPHGLYKSYWGGVVRLPEDFARRYTGGKTLALGFGG